MRKAIYVLHERGAKSHFIALEAYAKTNNTTIIFREFSVVRFLLKSIFKLDYALFVKQILNLQFLTALFFTNKKKIVLGIAPCDWRLVILKTILKNHEVFYFTSWTRWDGSFFPKEKLKNLVFIKDNWRCFLEKDVKGIFCVTATALKSLNDNYNLKCPLSVVNHSFEPIIKEDRVNRTNYDITKLIYVGRLIKEKGIIDLMELVSQLDSEKFSLTIVGNGELSSLVKSYTDKYSNINYVGFISSRKELFNLYKSHDVQLLFSRQSNNWEELFGMVIVEAMSQGVITISTSHSGPKEIIDDTINGFLVPDDKYIVQNVKNILLNKIGNLGSLKENAKLKSNQYLPKQLSLKWSDILNE